MAYITTRDKAKIYYEEHGSGDKTIFFIPGGGCTTRYFYKQVAGLSKYYHLVLMDLRGHGDSERTESNVSYEVICEDILDIMNHLGIEHCYLLGWSIGAQVALNFVKMFGEERVDGIIYFDMSPKIKAETEEELPLTQGCEGYADYWFEQLKGFAKPLTAEFATSFFLLGNHPEEHKDLWAFMEYEGTRISKPHQTALNISAITADLRDVLPTLTKPMLLAYGTSHKLYPQSAMDYVEAHVKDVTVLKVPEAGHAFFLEEPEMVNEAIVKFVDAH